MAEEEIIAEIEKGVHDQTAYYVDCSDCESPGEECFNPRQAAEFAVRDGWRLYGSRLLCPPCATKYPADVLRA